MSNAGGARTGGVSGSDGTGADTSGRKRAHLEVVRAGDVGHVGLTTGLEAVRLRARALPERDLDDVDLSLDLWGRRLRAPLLISSMTGGVSEAGQVNRSLATAAQHHRVALGLGSGRVLLERPEVIDSFRVRDLAPDALVLANIGAVQLRTYRPDDCARLVERCEADALIVHLNAVQEAVQPGGDTAFAGVLDAVEELVAQLDVPVVVKEVGFGLGPDDVAALAAVGVAGIDVAGAGGTNWARVEGHRDGRAAAVAEAFVDWGWPTAAAVVAARRELDAASGTAGCGQATGGPPHRGARPVLVGSGGLRTGVDALKVLCLGADLAGVARGLLEPAATHPQAAIEAVGVLVDQLRIGAWAAGAGSVDELTEDLLVR